MVSHRSLRIAPVSRCGRDGAGSGADEEPPDSSTEDGEASSENEEAEWKPVFKTDCFQGSGAAAQQAATGALHRKVHRVLRREVRRRLFLTLLAVACYVVPLASAIARAPKGPYNHLQRALSAAVPLLCMMLFESWRTDSKAMTMQAWWVLLLECLLEWWEHVALLVHWIGACKHNLSGPVGGACGPGLAYLWDLGRLIVVASVHFVALGAVESRVALMEETFGKRDHIPCQDAKCIRVARYVAAAPDVFMVCLCVLGRLICEREMPMQWFSPEVFLSTGVKGVVWTVAGIAAWRGFTRVLQRVPLQILADRPNSYLAAEAAWVRAVVSRVRWATTVNAGSHACTNLLWAVSGQVGRPIRHGDVLGEALIAVSVFLEFVTLLAMVGFFRPSSPSFRSGPNAPRPTGPISMETRSAAFQAKVKALAHRSIDAATLLDFYDTLGREAMPHFEPWRHTTNDVVKQAIIPRTLTATGGGVSYADKVAAPGAPGDRPMPDRWVSHSWTNLFLHLVAAVVAEALGQDEYEDIAEALASRDTGAIRARMARAGTGRRRYWICAFCINQHTACDQFPKPPPENDQEGRHRWETFCRDSVTEQLHKTCRCRERKPTDADSSEMNKFPETMGYLHLHSQVEDGFKLVAAVDRQLDLFTRAWVVAELVQAYLCAIPIGVSLYSNSVLELDNADLSIYTKLSTLSVRDCRASRFEDKAMILNMIGPNFHEFDAQLQTMIFGERGLMSRRLLGFDALESAARAAVRVSAAAGLEEGRSSPRCCG